MSRDHFKPPWTLALALACAALAVSLPAPAQAATYVMRPDSTVSNNWDVTPSTTSAFGVLDDAVLSPNAPSTSSDFLSSTAAGRTAEVGLGPQTLATGDSVAAITAWAYVDTGNRRPVTLTLLTGATSLGSVTEPAGSAAGWRSASTSTALTQAQVDDLRIRLTTGGSGASSASRAYAAYAELRTTGVLSLDTSAVPDFSTVLDGTDRPVPYSVPLQVADTRDTSSGWKLTVTSTQFSTGGINPRTLPTNASSVSFAASICAGGACVNPSNSVTYPVLVPAGPGPPAPNRFFNAASGTGSGQFTITPTIEVTVPANADAGTYTAAETFTIASGP